MRCRCFLAEFDERSERLKKVVRPLFGPRRRV